MPPPHFYRQLDDDQEHCQGDRLTIRLTTREIAERVCAMNHGVHRLLSHLVDVRRERLAARVAEYRKRGDSDEADCVEGVGDLLAAAIEEILNRGIY